MNINDPAIKGTITGIIAREALAYGWDETALQALVLHLPNVDTARRFIDAAKRLPNEVRRMILNDQRLDFGDEQARLAALQDAEKLVETMNALNSYPADARALSNFVATDGGGRRFLMSCADARTTLAKAVAETDVHIDTSRRADFGIADAVAIYDERKQTAQSSMAARSGASK